jgi:hypothetical protein
MFALWELDLLSWMEGCQTHLAYALKGGWAAVVALALSDDEVLSRMGNGWGRMPVCPRESQGPV